jgi:formylglycine-generating enzyme
MMREAVATSLAGVASPQRRLDLQGATFAMGSDDPGHSGDHEGPVRPVVVTGFAIDAFAVTNARFAAFVVATDHRSDAERLGGSFVFQGQLPSEVRERYPSVPSAPWWRYVAGAAWFAPEGPGSDPLARPDHPVVHVSWSDAVAFAAWAGGRLPSEAEWEYAARGGLEGARYPWGDELEPGGVHRCNVWQGRFPDHDSGADGYRGTAPVDAYVANGFGLYNVVGNVWEWCADAFAGREPQRVRKGGSFLCHHSYCRRYRSAARTSGLDTDTATNLGVRVAYDLERTAAATPYPNR